MWWWNGTECSLGVSLICRSVWSNIYRKHRLRLELRWCNTSSQRLQWVELRAPPIRLTGSRNTETQCGTCCSGLSIFYSLFKKYTLSPLLAQWQHDKSLKAKLGWLSQKHLSGKTAPLFQCELLYWLKKIFLKPEHTGRTYNSAMSPVSNSESTTSHFMQIMLRILSLHIVFHRLHWHFALYTVYNTAFIPHRT